MKTKGWQKTIYIILIIMFALGMVLPFFGSLWK